MTTMTLTMFLALEYARHATLGIEDVDLIADQAQRAAQGLVDQHGYSLDEYRTRAEWQLKIANDNVSLPFDPS